MEIDKLELFLTRDKIQELCKKLASKINKDFAKYKNIDLRQEKSPEVIALCILKGGLFFVADVLRYIDIPLALDFVKLSSYHGSTASSGTVTILQDISTDIKGKHIIIFDEIVDSGRTLSFYIERLKMSEPKSIKICTLIDKKDCRMDGINIKPDYIGTEAGKEFLLGYGLDYEERYRNLPDIYKLS
jgi:hypoxanthine phosphoribosyltransferase